MKNNGKPIAFLLKMLNISYTELANAISVERSVVNKWALGSRSFHSGSKHYEKVIDYVLKKNEENPKLEYFFDRIYPTQPKTDFYLQDSIDRFLSLPIIPGEFQNKLTEVNDQVLYYNIPVCGSTYSRFSALMQMLSGVSYSDEILEVILFDEEQFEWITENEYYSKCFKDQLVNILNKDHYVTIISDVHYLKRYSQFARLVPFLYPYKRFEEYFYMSNKNQTMNLSYYGVKGQMVLYGNKMPKGRHYTIVLRDEFSLEAFEEQIRIHLENCSLHFVVQNKKQLGTLFESIKEMEEGENPVYLCSPALSFMTMSRGLLLEVLKKYKIEEGRKNQILSLYDCYRWNMTQKKGKDSFKHLCHYQYLKGVVEVEYYLVEDLSILLGEKILLSRDEVRAYIQDTIDILESDVNYGLGLIRFPRSKEEIEFGFICKKNKYFLALQEIIKCVQEPNLINEVFVILDEEWESIPFDYKDNFEVAKKLRMLIES